MKKLFLASMAGVLITFIPSASFAQEGDETQTPYMQAYDACSEMADDQEVSDDAGGHTNWSEVFESCMEGKGFSEESVEDSDEVMPDEPHVDDEHMLDQ